VSHSPPKAAPERAEKPGAAASQARLTSVSATIRRFAPGVPRHVALAGASGASLGAVAAVIAYVSYFHAGGPAGAAVIPVSALIVAIGYGLLVRRHRRASDWLGLGYTVAFLLASGLLMAWEVLSGFYAELTFAAW
jgi:hypothetical protein